MIRIVSYYTEKYKGEADKLIASLEILNIRNRHIVSCPDLNDWQLNVQHRPYVLLTQLNKWPNDILAVDADATFERQPDWDYLESLDCDFAAHIMDKEYWSQDISKRKYSLMAGTLFLKNTEKTRHLMYLWMTECHRSMGKVWDMRLLEKVIGFDCWTGKTKGYKVENLPVEYCAIDRTMNVEKPIIQHHQASRRLKRA